MASGAESSNKALGVFHVINLDCSGCSVAISKALKRIDGVRSVRINYITDRVYVSYDPDKINPEQIRKAIENAGYKAFHSKRGMGAVI